MSKEIMTQATNKITIVGKLLDTTFNTGMTKDGRPYERANLTIRTIQSYGGRQETSEIPVSAFATQFTSKNTLNPAYESLQRLKELKTAQNVGIDAADTVKINSGSLRENAFVARSGQLISGWQIGSSFFNSGLGDDTATFSVDIYILDMREEVDREDEITGRLIVKGGIVQYGGKLDVVEFIVESPECVDHITRNWQVNDTVNARGRIRVTSQEEKRVSSESSWGEDVPDAPSTKIVRELIITTGSECGFDEERAYDSADIKKAFNVRKANMEQLQVNAKQAPVKATPQKSQYSWE